MSFPDQLAARILRDDTELVVHTGYHTTSVCDRDNGMGIQCRVEFAHLAPRRQNLASGDLTDSGVADNDHHTLYVAVHIQIGHQHGGAVDLRPLLVDVVIVELYAAPCQSLDDSGTQ